MGAPVGVGMKGSRQSNCMLFVTSPARAVMQLFTSHVKGLGQEESNLAARNVNLVVVTRFVISHPAVP